MHGVEETQSYTEFFAIDLEGFSSTSRSCVKDGQYGYPHMILYDGYMYDIVSRLKEAVEMFRFKV